MALTKRKLYPFILASTIIGYLWIGIILVRSSHNGISTCIIKNVTNIPCPSCGSTRSIIAFLNGDFIECIYWNPIGLILLFALVILPLWLFYDLVYKKESFLRFYLKVEFILKKPKYATLGIILIIVNWIWNIFKGL